MKEINELVNELSRKAINQQDEKFKEALRLWGIDENNMDEIKRNCRVDIDEKGFRNLYIKDKLVMMFTDWIYDNDLDYSSSRDNVKINMHFKCSEILTPEEYRLSYDNI